MRQPHNGTLYIWQDDEDDDDELEPLYAYRPPTMPQPTFLGQFLEYPFRHTRLKDIRNCCLICITPLVITDQDAVPPRVKDVDSKPAMTGTDSYN